MSRFSLKTAAAILVLALGGVSAAAIAQAQQQAPPADALADPATFKTPEVLAFAKIKAGDKVADIVAGRFVRALSNAVGPNGMVYAIEPAEVVAVHPEIMTMMGGLTSMPAYANVKVISQPINTPGLPSGLDVVFIRQNYHDLHDKFMGPADVPAFNKAVYAALKPGGYYVVIDHADAKGSGLGGTETRHRIDKATVIAEAEAAGFKLDGESTILANPADDHAKNVFDPSIRGHTDQFVLRFRKPK